MTLYHFTAEGHLPRILRAGYLKLCESNMSLRRANAGPPVVWLMDEPQVRAAHGLTLPGQVIEPDENGVVRTYKTGVRFTVEAPDAKPWIGSFLERNMTRRDRLILVQSGGGEEAAKHWWISPTPVTREQWTGVDLMDRGIVLPPTATEEDLPDDLRNMRVVVTTSMRGLG